MDPTTPLAWLGGLSPASFMRRHWQKKPLVVRQGFGAGVPLLGRGELFELATRDDVESRLVVQRDGGWRVRHGPLPRRALPSPRRAGWTLLVQGLDLHCAAAHELLSCFRFVPDARLDDLMLSWASDGGGVGPHLDSYDVFLIQIEGRRRWRVGRVADETLVDGAPLKILRHFEPEHEWLLEAGDLLYLPPRWGHDGVAVGECMTASVGFRASTADAIAGELLQRLADHHEDGGARYRDPRQPATATPAALPAELVRFAQRALERALAEPAALARALGEALSEPKPRVWFETGGRLDAGCAVTLDAKTRMLYDARHVFINGEAFEARGRDARLMHRLADERRLGADDCALLGAPARALLADWAHFGWLTGSRQ